MEAAARGEVTVRSGSPAATRYLSSSAGADSPSSPSVSAKVGGPIKIISTTVVRGGLTPKAGTGNLWGSRLGASGTTPDSPVTPGPGAPGTTSDRPVTAGLGASGTTPDSPVTPGLGASGTTPDSPVTPGLGTSGTSSDRPVAGLGASGTTSDNPVTPGPAVTEDPAALLDATPKTIQRVKQNLGSLWDSKLEEKEEKEKQEKIPTESVSTVPRGLGGITSVKKTGPTWGSKPNTSGSGNAPAPEENSDKKTQAQRARTTQEPSSAALRKQKLAKEAETKPPEREPEKQRPDPILDKIKAEKMATTGPNLPTM